MLNRSVAGSILAWALALSNVATHAATAENYPVRPLRIVTGEPGNGNDLASRLIAQGLTSSMGQQVIVENRPTTLVAQLVAKTLPDGYTLAYGSGSIWTGPLIEKLPYDPVKDLSPVTLATSSPLVLIVNPSVPVKSVKELVDLAKARPGQLNYASSAVGSNPHLAAELFKSMAGVNIVRVAYNGGTPGINAVVMGEVQMMFITPNAVLPLAKAGKLRVLAVGNAKRSALLPDFPTVAESGVPGYESIQMSGVFVPGKPPAAIVDRLNREIVRVLLKPDVKEKLASSGAEVVASTAGEFAAAIKKDMAIAGKVIKGATIKPDAQ